ncbi:MAG: hypothetical protein IPJ22_11215 [Bacteroidetes bacterium]|nr:hypothetical protein [Bacteroidota bacterium]
MRLFTGLIDFLASFSATPIGGDSKIESSLISKNGVSSSFCSLSFS